MKTKQGDVEFLGWHDQYIEPEVKQRVAIVRLENGNTDFICKDEIEGAMPPDNDEFVGANFRPACLIAICVGVALISYVAGSCIGLWP